MIDNEKIEGMASYTVGGSAIVVSMSEISTLAQQTALILGCIVVAIRVVHDAIGLYRKIRGKN